MRTTLIFLLIFTISFAEAQQLNIEKIRDQFFTMGESEDGALKLFKVLENVNLSADPVMLAYRGASSAASAGSVSGVRNKLEYFNRGKSELEKAISLKPLDAEIRFLRLATQVNAPGFLGYNGDVDYDKTLLFTTLKSVSSDHPNTYLYLRICRFLLSFANLTTAEKNTTNQLIKKFNTE